ncbi:MAG: ABC transporter permease, partial [Alphaproteobacteria bacterium]|nr:ABC transporter permease [Alphaproteobacteria bacterium]
MSKKHTLRYFSNFEWILALRYLRSQRKDGFISVIAGFSFLGIAVGVATMIVVLAVMNGFRKELMDKFLGFNGHIVAHSLSHNFSESELMRQRIMTVEGVRLAFPFIENAAMASKNGQAVGVLVRGLTPPDMQKITFITGSIRQGTSEGFDSRKGILIGARLAEKLRVFAGDQVTRLVTRGAYTPFGVTPRNQESFLITSQNSKLFSPNSTKQACVT